MHLNLVSTRPAPTSEFAPQPIDLVRQPWRPGELCDVVDLHLAKDLRKRLDGAAAEQGVPLAVVVLAAVESERVIGIAAAASGRTRGAVTALLDAAADVRPERGVDPPPVRRLRAYALAILAGTHPPTEAAPAQLAVRVSQSLVAVWSIAATTEASSLEQWIVSTLERAELTRTRWEAVAAYAGRALESWAAVALLMDR